MEVLEVVKYVLPALVVVLVVSIILSKYERSLISMQRLKQQNKHSKEALPLKLQAYERISLLVYRISLENMIPRVQHSEMSAEDLKKVLIQTIQEEYDHNVTQRIYVSDALWRAVKTYKQVLLGLIRDTYESMEKSTDAYTYGKALLEKYMGDSNLFDAEKVDLVLKTEVKNVIA